MIEPVELVGTACPSDELELPDNRFKSYPTIKHPPLTKVFRDKKNCKNTSPPKQMALKYDYLAGILDTKPTGRSSRIGLDKIDRRDETQNAQKESIVSIALTSIEMNR